MGELRTLRPSEGSRLLEVTRGIGPGQGIVTSVSSGPAERGRSFPVARRGGWTPGSWAVSGSSEALSVMHRRLGGAR